MPAQANRDTTGTGLMFGHAVILDCSCHARSPSSISATGCLNSLSQRELRDGRSRPVDDRSTSCGDWTPFGLSAVFLWPRHFVQFPEILSRSDDATSAGLPRSKIASVSSRRGHGLQLPEFRGRTWRCNSLHKTVFAPSDLRMRFHTSDHCRNS